MQLEFRHERAFDISPGVRFIRSRFCRRWYQAIVVAALGVLLFEVLLNATSMFYHGNAHA